MNLAGDVVESCLGSAIRCVWEVTVLHITYASRRSAQGDELGSLGFVEKR